MSEAYRVEHDSLGEFPVLKDAYYGIHTARAVKNFTITNIPLSHFPELVKALAKVKKACALTNHEYDLLSDIQTNAIIEACDDIIAGEYHDQFIVDMMQGGAGTSTNMNANEVIANLALEKMGHSKGEYQYLHPNDHVNCSQSTNDVYPTSARIAVLSKCEALTAAQHRLSEAFRERARAFSHIVKVGRTQLQDAVPITLGSEFDGYAVTLDEDVERVEQLSQLLKEINLGGTAIGTCINTPPHFSYKAVRHLSALVGYELIPAANLIEASSDMGGFVTFSSVLRRMAVKLSKICNDLRLLSSGPCAGIGEISLPPVQAGSSIMPGKVNPVIPEVVNQVAFQVIGNDLTITMAAEAGQLQLNVMEPVIILNILQSIRMLANAMDTLTDKCIHGIKANERRCEELLTQSSVMATALVPLIGYEKAADIAKLSLTEHLTVPEAAERLGIMTPQEVEDAFSSCHLG
ncbi:MAG: aspartate ammonia-lyase [Desulfovibrionales bacterium]|nr:aspartate ammonia-lyase [Desulfovibrionales bacterium]